MRGTVTFRIKPHTFQRHSRGLKRTLCTPGPRATQRLRQNCVWVCPEDMHLIFSQISLRISSMLFLLFTLFCSLEFISKSLPSSSLIHSSASDIQLLIHFRVFLILVMVLFFSVSLFFNTSRDFFIDFYTFSVLFSRLLLIFTIILF